MSYIINNKNAIMIGGERLISNADLLKAINFCNNAIRTLDEQTKQFDINIFEVLGMRTLVVWLVNTSQKALSVFLMVICAQIFIRTATLIYC